MVIEKNHRSGQWLKHMNVRVLTLNTFPHFDMIKEIAFIFWVLGLAFSEIKEFTSVYSNPKHLIEEDVIEKRYATRLKILNYAAFQGCFEYKPCARNSPWARVIPFVRHMFRWTELRWVAVGQERGDLSAVSAAAYQVPRRRWRCAQTT